MLQNGICSLPDVLLAHMFYGISTPTNMSVLMKSSPLNVKTHSNTCIFSIQYSVSFIFIAMLCLLYILCLNILSWDIKINPGPLNGELYLLNISITTRIPRVCPP